jgi:opacity protein-like surface antigen
MARKWFGSAMLLGMISLLAVSAAAQSNDVAGIIGRTFVSDQGVTGTPFTDSNIHFGDHISYELSYGKRIADIGIASLTIEVPFVHDPDVKLNYAPQVVPKSYSAFFLTPSARISLFPGAGISPWISGGGGFAHFSESSTLQSGAPNPGSTGTTTGAIQLGVGLDVRIIGSVKLRGEMRDFYTGVPDLNVNPQKKQHNMFAGAGIVFSF